MVETARGMEKIFPSCPSDKVLISSLLKNSKNKIPKECIIQLISKNQLNIQFYEENDACPKNAWKIFNNPMHK
jgi:hypothetical protein